MIDRKQKYLQIALNSTLEDARSIIGQIPLDKRIILEAGTPLIKAYGRAAISSINSWWQQRVFGTFFSEPFGPAYVNPFLLSLGQKFTERGKTGNQKNISGAPPKKLFSPYIVADLKCMDRGAKEVEIARIGGANAVVALGHAPVETLDAFIEECDKNGLDSMIDMMNVEFPLGILRQLKKPPQAVILHRGVDEEAFDPESEIPYHEIQRIKNEYDIMVAVAGGDTFQEVQRAIFNDADIVVVWKSFYQSTDETAKLAEQFLKEIR